MDNVFVSVIFEFTGALIKWFFIFLYSSVKGKKPVGFREIWGGEKDSQYHEIFLLGISNLLTGFAFYFLLIISLVFVFL